MQKNTVIKKLIEVYYLQLITSREVLTTKANRGSPS